jgi:hypothetical protein
MELQTRGFVESDSGSLLVPAHTTSPSTSGRPVFYMPDGSKVEVDPNLPPVPAGLMHLDIWAGRAVPYIAWRTASGTVDLTDVDGERYLACVRDELCGMCALPLSYWKAWLMSAETRPENREPRVMTEPGMHRPCARYARAVWWRDRTWMLVTRSYRVQDGRDPKRPIVVRIAPSVTIEHLP